MRLIDADALIEKAECLFKDLNSTEAYMGIGYNHGVGDSIAIIKNAPTIEAEPVKHRRWIPVNERLPKKDGRYLVTRYDYVTSTEFIDILWYEKNLWWNMRYTGDYAVTAWMPLPGPYTEEGEEQ